MTTMPSLRLAVFLSGSGTTLQNFIDRIAAGRLDARIVSVVASKAGAFGLERAAKAGLPTTLIERKQCTSVEDFSEKLFANARAAQADLVLLAGFLQLIRIPADFTNRVMNIHPGLIPAFCGKGMYGHHVHEAVLALGAKVSGCTVHFVDNEYDHGPIVLQRTVPVLDDDTPDTLAARVFAAECEAYPEAVRLFAEGKLTVVGRKVRAASLSAEMPPHEPTAGSGPV